MLRGTKFLCGERGIARRGCSAAHKAIGSSAARESRVLFRFDGKFYRQSECFDISLNGSTPEGVEKVPCK
jgi:hypothetical protein